MAAGMFLGKSENPTQVIGGRSTAQPHPIQD